jgi:hypothetical protein
VDIKKAFQCESRLRTWQHTPELQLCRHQEGLSES